MSTPEFRFEPPDRRRVWKHLALTMSQAATLTGVSERQIQHWMDRGYIDPSLDGGRKVSGDSIDLILLIKQARSAGIPLRQAVPLARTYLQEEAAGALDSAIARHKLHDLRERLGSTQREMTALESLLADIGRRDGNAPVLPGVSRHRV